MVFLRWQWQTIGMMVTRVKVVDVSEKQKL
ncbi:hypothetical protein O9993_16530 [Vibrio lentus]|nr:hypothetical protein [Vibrio lentus]